MTLASAKTDLYELLCSDPELGLPATALAGLVVRVFKGEPQPGTAPKPSAVTVFTDSVTAEDYLFRVRVYVDPSTDPIVMQDTVDACIDAISALIDTSATFGRSDWQHGYDPAVDALVAQTVVDVGREDF